MDVEIIEPPSDPDDDYYLIYCFVCKEMAKPGNKSVLRSLGAKTQLLQKYHFWAPLRTFSRKFWNFGAPKKRGPKANVYFSYGS
jgi:hypothetical protein